MHTIDIWSHIKYNRIMREIDMFVQSKELTKSLLISSMTLRGETPPKSSSIGGRKISPQKLFKTIADRLQVSQGKWVGSAKGILPMLIICVDIPKLLGLGSALLQNYPLTKGKYYVSSRNNNKEESRYGTRI